MKSPLLLFLSLVSFLAAPQAYAATIRAYGTVLFLERDGIGSLPPSLTALVAGDEFAVDFEYNDTVLETAPGSYLWPSAITSFSLVRTGGPGSWQPTGTWITPINVASVSGNFQIEATATGMPNWTGSDFAFNRAILRLQGGTIFRDNDTSSTKSLGTRLGGGLSPNVSSSLLELIFFNGTDSRVSAGFRFQTFVPEPTTAAYLGLAAASCLRRRRLGKSML